MILINIHLKVDCGALVAAGSLVSLKNGYRPPFQIAGEGFAAAGHSLAEGGRKNSRNAFRAGVVDIIDSDITPFLNHNMASEFSNLKAKYGTFATLGNHDILTKSEDEIVRILKENSITVLRDEATLINNSFYIIGRDDITISRFTNKPRASLENLTKNLDKSKPLIVVDHNPKYLNESLDANIDLQLSGHTHKGQIAPGNIVTNKLFEVHYGYLKKDNLNVVVSSGYGTWGPPVRLGSKSEIVQINLQMEQPQ